MSEQAFEPQSPSPAPAAMPSLQRRGIPWLSADKIVALICRLAAASVLVMLAMLLIVLTASSTKAIRQFGPRFLVRTEWRANEREVTKRDAHGKIVYDADDEPVKEILPPVFGAAPVIWGTAVSSTIALLFAVPLSLGTALFLIRIAPNWLRPTTSFLIEFLAAIPSIAYGIWGLFVLAPFLQGGTMMPAWLAWTAHLPVIRWFFYEAPNWSTPDANDVASYFRGFEPILYNIFGGVPGLKSLFMQNGHAVTFTGKDMLCGGLILGVMILPIITAISRDVLAAVPRAQIEGTLALGATWWQSAKQMLSYSRAGLFGAVMLGLARAAGETMAVTMVIGNANQVALSPFAPAQTMSSLLATQFPEAADVQRAALTEVALILLVMSLLFNVVARYLVVGKNARTAAAV